MWVLVGVLWSELVARVAAVRSPERRDRGASALEWAIIAAISVVIATIIGTIVYNVVTNKANQVKNCGAQPVGGNCGNQ
jgi:Flp pilus assembly pilin Flp